MDDKMAISQPVGQKSTEKGHFVWKISTLFGTVWEQVTAHALSSSNIYDDLLISARHNIPKYLLIPYETSEASICFAYYFRLMTH